MNSLISGIGEQMSGSQGLDNTTAAQNFHNSPVPPDYENPTQETDLLPEHIYHTFHGGADCDVAHDQQGYIADTTGFGYQDSYEPPKGASEVIDDASFETDPRYQTLPWSRLNQRGQEQAPQYGNGY
jgi:hypothetical protein